MVLVALGNTLPTEQSAPCSSGECNPAKRGSLIYFMLPDEPAPSGGIRFSYTMVDTLNSSGFAAAIWHGASRSRMRWFANETNVVNGLTLRLEPGDVLVVPEWGGPGFAGLTAGANVVMLVQNHFYVFDGVDAMKKLPGSYPGWPNAVAALVTSHAIQRFVESAIKPSLPVHLVPYTIDPELFCPSRKERLIAFMPRKRRADLAAIVQLLQRSESLAGWGFQSIDGLTEADTAAVMSRAAIFLSGSDREGFGLPPAEAMAAGCYVVGFTGDGGREFMLPELCTVVQDQDLSGFAAAVEATANAWDSDRAGIDSKTEDARHFITQNYGHERMRESVNTAFTEITALGSPALQTAAVDVFHFRKRRSTPNALAHRWIPPAALGASKQVRSRLRRK